MLLTEFIAAATARLEHIYPTAEARAIVLTLCEHVIGTKSYTHIVEPKYVIVPARLPLLESDLSRLAQGEPIQYVTGHSGFCGLDFRVSRDVLIPRPETELLCREAIKIGGRFHRMRIPYGKKAVPVRVLDLCTGSGCIAWVMALSVQGARVVGIDNSEAALKVARSQDFSAQLKEAGAEAPDFVKADVLAEEITYDGGPFDLILSNPPYIKESEMSQMRRNVLDYEPASALFVPDADPLLYYRAIAAWSRKFLSPEGFGITEINETLGPDTEAVFRSAGFPSTELIKDFYDKKRFVLYHR